MAMLQLRSLRVAALAVGLCAAVAAADTPFPKPRLTPERRAVLESISANSLRGHLSFIASDALEGRGTPSRGLDLAAEYVAAQFRRAGLEPAGDDGYFQTASYAMVTPNSEGLEFEVDAAGGAVKARSASMGLQQ